MKKLLRLFAVVVTGLSLTTGIAAASSGSIGTTGPDSRNSVESRSEDKRRVDNNNNIRVKNHNPQEATSGDATADRNTTAGGATTGEAENDSLLRASISLTNSGAMNGAGNGGQSHTGTINNTGPDSHNTIRFNNSSDVRVNNNNNVTVENYNHQQASSGTAVVSRNTTGGSATSGNASNISTNDVTVNVTN